MSFGTWRINIVAYLVHSSVKVTQSMYYSAHEPPYERRTARIRRENRGPLSGLAGEHAWKI